MGAVMKFIKWLNRHLWRHKWEYYNPYDRECTVCGRHEVEHMWRENLPNLNSPGWWEVFDDGDETKHYINRRLFSRIIETGDIL